MDIIIATEGSVLFGVGYHGWIVTTRDENIILSRGGPDDWLTDIMSSYRLELGGTVAGLAALGTLFRSGQINIRSVRFICDNRSAVLAAKRPITNSILFNTKGDWDRYGTWPIAQLVQRYEH
jgi:hypothetical protein